MRVLVVDDNVDSADTLSQVLELLGYQTRTAHDGWRGGAQAAEFAPDVVLLDIGLPRMSGHEAARQIRLRERARTCCWWSLSGWGQDDDLRRSKEAGFDHHFVKPVDIDALLRLPPGRASDLGAHPAAASALRSRASVAGSRSPSK